MLETVAIARPQTNGQLLSLPGFGPAKCEKYGQEILAVVREFTADHDEPS
jgi:hypothetical protein